MRDTISAVEGIDVQGKLEAKLCEPCVLGKTTAANAPKHGTQPTKPLEVLYADTHFCPIDGSMGMRMNVKIQDGYTGFLHTYFVPDHTSESAFTPFHIIVKRWERQTGCKVKFLRTDNGAEFQGAFNEYYASEGVTHQVTLPYTHNSHGKVERANQSIMSTAGAMLLASNLPDKYYDEAMLHATYLHNRTCHGRKAKHRLK